MFAQVCKVPFMSPETVFSKLSASTDICRDLAELAHNRHTKLGAFFKLLVVVSVHFEAKS